MTSDEPAQRSLTVNGQRVEVHVEGQTALLYVLRNHLGLKGTRFGCGLGACGACYVLVDGRPTYSCDTPVSTVVGTEITTVEGLGACDAHPVILALRDAQAAQCGYCMSGHRGQVGSASRRDTAPDARGRVRRTRRQPLPMRRPQPGDSRRVGRRGSDGRG
jgi:aerobic-type carbon monoxide dehydrogenase small subunit (CoxS/CutS family)